MVIFHSYVSLPEGNRIPNILNTPILSIFYDPKYAIPSCTKTMVLLGLFNINGEGIVPYYTIPMFDS